MYLGKDSDTAQAPRGARVVRGPNLYKPQDGGG